MYYLLANGADPLRRWTPAEAIDRAINSIAPVVLFASIDLSFAHQEQVLLASTGERSLAVDVDLVYDEVGFEKFVASYYKEQAHKTLFLHLPDGQLFMETVRERIGVVLSLVKEKGDRILLFSNADGTTGQFRTEKLPDVDEMLLFYGIRPADQSFFDCQSPKSPFWYIAPFPCDPILCELRNAFADVDINKVKELFQSYHFTDENTGGLIATFCCALFFRSFSGNAIRQIEQILDFLVEKANADVNYVLAEDGGTVLHLVAVVFGSCENAALLIQLLKKSNVDLLKKNIKQQTPFDAANDHMQMNKHVLLELVPDNTES